VPALLVAGRAGATNMENEMMTAATGEHKNTRPPFDIETRWLLVLMFQNGSNGAVRLEVDVEYRYWPRKSLLGFQLGDPPEVELVSAEIIHFRNSAVMYHRSERRDWLSTFDSAACALVALRWGQVRQEIIDHEEWRA